MAKNSDAIPYDRELREALDAPGCALCYLTVGSAVRYIDTLLWQMVNEPDVRAALNAARGYCNFHAWMLPRRGGALGVAILMHGNRTVSTKNLARQIGAKTVEPCRPEVANRHSGYLVGGTSPFGLKRDMPVYVEASVLELPKIWINGGRRGFLVGVEPAVLSGPLGANPVRCALAE